MIPPMLLLLQIPRAGQKALTLWLPLFLLWLLLLPLIIIVTPFVLLVALVMIDSQIGRMLLYGGPRVWAVLCALRGLTVDVIDGSDHVCIIFW